MRKHWWAQMWENHIAECFSTRSGAREDLKYLRGQYADLWYKYRVVKVVLAETGIKMTLRGDMLYLGDSVDAFNKQGWPSRLVFVEVV